MMPLILAAFIDASGYFQGPAFAMVLRSLEQQFDDICGDTFCEGDYSDIVSLGITCSIDAATLRAGACTWAFAGAESDVDPATGGVTIAAKTFVCDLGVRGTAAELLAFVKAASAPPATGLVSSKLPGSGKTLYDTLTSCL